MKRRLFCPIFAAAVVLTGCGAKASKADNTADEKPEAKKEDTNAHEETSSDKNEGGSGDVSGTYSAPKVVSEEQSDSVSPIADNAGDNAAAAHQSTGADTGSSPNPDTGDKTALGLGGLAVLMTAALLTKAMKAERSAQM